MWRRGRRWVALVSLVALVGRPVPGWSADLYEEARGALNVRVGRQDHSGFSVRGGALLTTGQTATSQTLLRARATTQRGCGAFDFAVTMKETFEELPELMEALAQAILANIPMLVICYASPTGCDLIKHFQALANLAVQAKYGQCQQIQMAMQYAGSRLRGGSESQCLEEQVAAGASLNRAMNTCSGGVTSLRLPNGEQGSELRVVQDTLQYFGASQETVRVANQLLGEVTLQTGQGRLNALHDRPRAPLLQRYESHRTDATSALQRAVDEFASSGALSEATLREISTPGQEVPVAAIQALAALRQDPVRYEALSGKLAGGTAIVRLTWECQELQDMLAAAADGTQNLTDETRRLLENRKKQLDIQLQQTIAKITVVEKHLQPALQELFTEYEAVQSMATQAGLRAPAVTLPPMPFRRQVPGGYAQ